jgi:hypothetical protein
MDKAQLESLLTRIDIWLLVFGIIVVIGVAGESFWGIRHWWNSRKLQVIQHAEEQSRGVEIAQLHKETAAANESAEKERLARIELEQQLVPRRLTANQRERLVGSLHGFTGGVTIVSPMLDPEATDFGDDFEVALKAAGWETLRIRDFITVKTGVSVGAFIGSGPLPGIRRLHEALNAAGIANNEVVIGEDEEQSTAPNFQAGYIYLLVKRKAQPQIRNSGNSGRGRDDHR